MKVVSNAGPLMNLGKLGLVHLLHQLYATVLIPASVYDEVVVRGSELGKPDAYAVQSAVIRRELVVVQINDADLSQALRSLHLGKGEKELIQLGLIESADYVLLDDALARDEAQKAGLRVKGTLGVIVEAYRQNRMSLAECDLVFQAILARPDIWIHDALVRRIWQELKGS